MSPRARLVAFGSAAGVVVAGAICAAVFAGIAGELVGVALITLGLGAVVLLVFLEVGLSEDRERAEDQERRRRRAVQRERSPRRPLRWPRRPV